MPCPYAEKKGPIVICKVLGKKVNPLAHPCLTNRYTKCKYYKKAIEKEKKLEEAVPTTEPYKEKIMKEITLPARQEKSPKIEASPYSSLTISTSKPISTEKRETKGMTLDGRKPTNCLECIYYGSKTKTCILLGVQIKDPYDPPCAKT